MSYAERLARYEAGKRQIARTAESWADYEKRVRELAKRLGI
jgi:hypothetical protein